MKNSNVDRGFELRYWKLSYRRKFLCNLFLLPLCIVILVISILKSPFIISDTIFYTFTLLILLMSTIDNYYLWKKNK